MATVGSTVEFDLSPSTHSEERFAPVPSALRGVAEGELGVPEDNCAGERWLRRALRRLVEDRRGVTALEYGVIVALILLVCIASIGTVGNEVYVTLFSKITDAMVAIPR
jgi:pilus assembly protein Flp/PilA